MLSPTATLDDLPEQLSKLAASTPNLAAIAGVKFIGLIDLPRPRRSVAFWHQLPMPSPVVPVFERRDVVERIAMRTLCTLGFALVVVLLLARRVRTQEKPVCENSPGRRGEIGCSIVEKALPSSLKNLSSGTSINSILQTVPGPVS